MIETHFCHNGCCKIQIDYSLFSDTNSNTNKKAGIFIYNPTEDRVLLVQSKNELWGPPKGSLKENETYYDCAIREVKEETGIELKYEQLTRVVRIKNSVYYYAEIDNSEYLNVTIQNSETSEMNDANGITWIKTECLEKMINSGQIKLNLYAIIILKKFLKKSFSKSDFVFVKKRKRKNKIYSKLNSTARIA